MKHAPFDSNYKPEFEVVEQRDGKFRLYPHTEQLPALLRALNLEFYGGLPARLARADHRADGFHKILLHRAATMFCAYINRSRKDSLRIIALPDADLVARITIVQQITDENPRGPAHHFRFYGGEDFFPEILLSGKRLRFADHVLQRFNQRVPSHIGGDMTCFLMAFYGCPVLSMPVGPGRAFILLYDKAILGFPYRETKSRFFIKTCLTANEINSLEVEIPPNTLNLHYGEAFTKPKIRNWMPLPWMMGLYDSWRTKKMPGMTSHPAKKLTWYRVASLIKDVVVAEGFGPGSHVSFLDHIPGPCVLESRPGQIEPQHNEMEEIERILPQFDWENAGSSENKSGERD